MMGLDINAVCTVADLSGKNTSELARIARETDKVPLLEGLADHDSDLVRGALCENPNLPAALIRRLKEDPSEHVRNKAATLQAPAVTDVVEAVRDEILKD